MRVYIYKKEANDDAAVYLQRQKNHDLNPSSYSESKRAKLYMRVSESYGPRAPAFSPQSPGIGHRKPVLRNDRLGAAEAGPDLGCSRAGVCYPVVLEAFLASKPPD